MFKQEKDWKPELRHEVRNGKGDVTFNHIYAKGSELNPNMRLFAKLVLEPGCSIGWPVHENEEEIFYLLAGQARIDDNGTEVIASAGDSVITRSGEGHSVACEGTDTLEILACIIRYGNE